LIILVGIAGAFLLPSDPVMIDREIIGNLERLQLEQFERQLLRQHHVAGDKVARGHEAQHGCGPSLVIELLDVELETVLDPIVPARVAASDIKKSVPLVPLTLSRRKILPEKPDAPRLRFRRGPDNPKHPEQCFSIDIRPRQRVLARAEAAVRGGPPLSSPSAHCTPKQPG